MSKIPGNKSQIVIYQAEDGQTKIDVRFEGETVWLTQSQMAELFGKGRTTITEHIQNIFKEGELSENVVCREFRHTTQHGAIRGKTQDKTVTYYNLDVIISVGYRVKSLQGTRFRQWATQRLREYIVKGFALDDERLKNPDHPFDYFEELTRRIQDIRTSERRFYQKITDIYATSVDYDPALEISIDFFKTVQNKMHWAITGKTAAEIIYERADSMKPNMGLKCWRGEKPRRQDVSIAKNYMDEKELLALNNLVEQYLIFAEGQAMRRIPMAMNDWIKKLHGFLTLNERNILTHAGRIAHEIAKEHAEKEYDKFHARRIKDLPKYQNDFDKSIKMIEGNLRISAGRKEKGLT